MDDIKRAGSYVYGVYHGSQWTVTHSKSRAIRRARATGGFVVRNVYQRNDMWDSITFAMVGTVIADYRRHTS
jgi:surface polysaccharide O-acyltransferase-like enzyme